MSTEEWGSGYYEGYMKGWNDAMDEKPAQTDWESVAADQAMTIALLKAEQPAQRTWVGLTRRERFEIEKAMSKYYDYQHECKTVCLPEFAAAIEAKLKEKNT